MLQNIVGKTRKRNGETDFSIGHRNGTDIQAAIYRSYRKTFNVEIPAYWQAAGMRDGELDIFCLLELPITKTREGGMFRKNRKIQVLNVLYRNSQKDHPQVVSSKTIADQLNMNLPELQKVLKSMEGMGVIETDPDLRLNLITREGLVWLEHQSHNDLRSPCR